MPSSYFSLKKISVVALFIVGILTIGILALGNVWTSYSSEQNNSLDQA